MKILINLKYQGQLVDTRMVHVNHPSKTIPDVDLDITRVVDRMVNHCVKRISEKGARASKRSARQAKTADPHKRRSKGISKP